MILQIQCASLLRQQPPSQLHLQLSAFVMSGKTAAAGKYDMTRKMGSDQRDPRSAETTWPCYGRHDPEGIVRNGNAHGTWSKCGTCALRTEYVPARNAPATHTHTDLPMNVQEALSRMKASGATDIHHKQVTAMIAIVAAEKQLLQMPKAAKSKAGKQKDPAPEHRAKSPRRESDWGNRAAQEQPSGSQQPQQPPFQQMPWPSGPTASQGPMQPPTSVPQSFHPASSAPSESSETTEAMKQMVQEMLLMKNELAGLRAADLRAADLHASASPPSAGKKEPAVPDSDEELLPASSDKGSMNSWDKLSRSQSRGSASSRANSKVRQQTHKKQ
jgi:hypothetical protein